MSQISNKVQTPTTAQYKLGCGSIFYCLSLNQVPLPSLRLSPVMAHPPDSPSCNGSNGVHSLPTVSKALPSVISGASVRSQVNSARHHVQWSDPLVHTRGIPARGPQVTNTMLAADAPSVTSNSSSLLDTGTIAGAMKGLNLTPSASTAPSTNKSLPQTFPSLCPQLTSTSQVAHQGSSIAMPRDPNLRFIFQRRLLAAQARGPLNHIDSNVIKESPATTGNMNMPSVTFDSHFHISGPQSLMPVVSEAVLNQSNGTVESTTNVIDLTHGSDEENNLLQKQPKDQKSTQKQRNVSINVTLEILK
jgi:hypothetical protein